MSDNGNNVNNKNHGNGKDYNRRNHKESNKSTNYPDGTSLLFGQLSKIYKDMYKDQLDLLEQILIITASEKKETMFPQLRSKVLRIGNNALRTMGEELNKYSIRPKQIVHDIIVPPEKQEINT